ncbi:Glycerophosphocholine phosphodiesterase, partial [Coemansia sp. RSA 1285]
LELNRSVTIRRLALQQYPIDLANVSKGALDAMESVTQAVVEYAGQLGLEAQKVAGGLKTIDSMTSPARIGQLLAVIEILESKLQGLIRYVWAIENDWCFYVKGPETPAKAKSAEGKEVDSALPKPRLFQQSFLRDLDTWHMILAKAIARARARLSGMDYGQEQQQQQQQQQVITESASVLNSLAAARMLSPHQWSAGYVLEKYKRDRLERSEAEKHDTWLDAVPLVTETRVEQESIVQLTDICRRNVLHYAAHNPADIAQLKHLHGIDTQDVDQQQRQHQTPAIAMHDLFGDTPLTIAAAGDNIEAVRYILEESGSSGAHEMLANAAVAALARGSKSCLDCIVRHLAKQPEQVALAIRLSMFYGLEELFKSICAALTVAGASACGEAEVALEHSARMAGGCTILHLAVLNGWTELIKCALEQPILRMTEFNAQLRDDTWLAPLDIANFFGYRSCANQLVNTFTFFCPPLSLNFEPEDEALRVKPFVAKTKKALAPPDAYAVHAVLGTNDLRRIPTMPPITIDSAALHRALDGMDLPRSTQLVLRMDSQQGTETGNADGWVMDVSSMIDAPKLMYYAWQPPAHFYTRNPEGFVLELDLVALVDQALAPSASERRVVAKAAVQIPPTFVPARSERSPGDYAPVCPAAGSYLSAVFVAPATGQTVAKANIEITVAAPYMSKADGPGTGPRTLSGSPNTTESWQEPGQTLVYGHRGSGMNFAPSGGPQKLQLGENTVLSMEQAMRDGVSGVEFDVQMTRDMVPVLYHDWTMAETGLDIPISSLSLKQFSAGNPRNNKRLLRARSTEALPQYSSSSALSDDSAEAESETDDDSKPPVHIANSANTVQAPLATLEDLFKSLPEDLGFDIEIKYPMPDEADGARVYTNFEINLFVDRILDVVYKYLGAPLKSALPRVDSGIAGTAMGATPAIRSAKQSVRRRRPIVFTSFHPDICLLLAHKIGNGIPIMLLTDAGMSEMADVRCNSIDAAVRLCNWAGLAGIVTHVAPISQSPRVVSLVRRHSLVLATYGTPANQPEHVRQQQAYGVDIVIVDDVRTARSTIDAGDDAWR